MSHTAVDPKPEKMTLAGDIEKSMAKRKKRSAVRCCGIIPVAQKPMVMTASAAAFDFSCEKNAGGYVARMIPAVIASRDMNNLRLRRSFWFMLIYMPFPTK